MQKFMRRLVQLIFPARCAGCQKTGPDLVCEECAARLETVIPRYCMNCGRQRLTAFASPDCAECHGRDIGVNRSRSAFLYNEMGRKLLAEFKFNGNLGVGQELSELILARIPARPARIFDRPGLRMDAILPVPLHPLRRRERRFNQSELLARLLSDHTKLPMRTDLLIRSKETGTQVGLTEAQRRANVQGAFDVPERFHGTLTGKRFIVVDDLMTTGSTLASCARALRRRGAGEVFGLTLFSTIPESRSGAPVEPQDPDIVPPPLL
jgi:ComF family protein